jgi:ABC-type molybdate transport system substrate-binding protein
VLPLGALVRSLHLARGKALTLLALTARVTVLHAGSLTTPVREHLAPAVQQADGISLESVPGHSVALAMALKDQRLSGDAYLSADAEVNHLLLGPTNGAWIRWFSAAVLENAANPHTAQQVVASLLSPNGQHLVQAAHFLPGTALVGGDVASVPEHLQSFLGGAYPSAG